MLTVPVLHSLKLVHTDLKPENILLVSNESRLSGPRVSKQPCITLTPARQRQVKVHSAEHGHQIDRLWKRNVCQRVPLVGSQYTTLPRARDYSW